MSSSAQITEEYPDFSRASGDCICCLCQKKYIDHSYSTHRDYSGAGYLIRLCDGSLVKL